MSIAPALRGDSPSALTAHLDVRILKFSAQQQRIWGAEQLRPGAPAHHLVFKLEIDGLLDLARLREALAGLARRHELLRAVVLEAAAPPDWRRQGRAMILPDPHVALETADLQGRLDAEAEAARQAQAHATAPFDLLRGPLWRCLAVTLGPSRNLLQVTQHRLIADERSRLAFAQDLAALYEAGPAAEPPTSRLRHTDSVRRERQDGPDEAEVLAWWSARAAGLPRLALPASRSPRVRDHRGDRTPVIVPAQTAARLSAFADAQGWVPEMALLVAWACVLHRYSGQADFAMGVSACYGSGDAACVLGPLSQTRVLRCEAGGQPTFAEMAARLAAESAEASARPAAFFETLTHEQGRDDLELTPLFQASFAFEPTAGLEDWRGGRTVGGALWRWGEAGEPGGTAPGVARADIGLMLERRGARLAGAIEYATDLFDAGFAEGVARAFEILLEAALAKPDTAVASLPLLPDAERRRLLQDWNDTAADLGDLGPVQQQVAARARAAPGALAVSCGVEALTYGELDRRSNRLAWRLRALGVAPGVVVGLCLERSIDMVVGLLGILKAGGAYLPLDPEYPTARLQFMLQDSDARVLVTKGAWAASVGAFGGGVLRLDLDAASIAEASNEALPATVTASDLAYVIYTSGSTGKPKGVAVAHAGLTNIVAWYAGEMGVVAVDTLLAVSPLTFDIATLEMFLPLTQGAAIRLLTREASRNGETLREEVADATLMQGTPATWQLLLEAGWEGNPELRALSGGEPLSADLAARLARRTKQAWNGYGPTECSIYACVWRVDLQRGRVSIGRPVANTRAYVLDGNLQPQPVGVPGELYLGGIGVARGYLGLPELTRERFLADPFEEGGRLYRTGDHVRWAGDGRLEFLERKDAQIKIRGYRIELGEIEAALSDHPEVSRCAVIARRDGDRAQLEAYYVPAAGPVDGQALRSHLRRSLPEHMVPVAFVALEALPLSSSGKVDRHALAASPAPAPAIPEGHQEAAGLAGAVSEIWRQVLKRPSIDPVRSFFEQGGDSLQILTVQRKIRESLGVTVPATDLFRYPTVTEIAAHISGLQAGGAAPASVAAPVPRAPDPTPSPIEGISSLTPEEVERRLLESVRQVIAEPS